MTRAIRKTGERLRLVLIKSPKDYEPWGNDDREKGEYFGADCSSGCKFYVPLEGMLGADWGVCSNPESHRAGLLTFEHQGCRKFERNRR